MPIAFLVKGFSGFFEPGKSFNFLKEVEHPVTKAALASCPAVYSKP
jgi:hypothetical protein